MKKVVHKGDYLGQEVHQAGISGSDFSSRRRDDTVKEVVG